jgi:hypothetical protein
MTNRCTTCLMPETYPDISFDTNGVCVHCTNHVTPAVLGEEALISKIRARQGKEYDCVVGLSGGKDSCYVAWLAKRKFGLRVLAVTYDFPFMVDLARSNCEKVCTALNIDRDIVTSENNLEYSLLRSHLISLSGTGTTWGQCLFCHYGIDAVLHQAAKSRGIPYILGGTTRHELWWNPGSRVDLLLKRVKKMSFTDKVRFAFFQFKAFLRLVDQRRQFPLPGANIFSVYKKSPRRMAEPETIPVFDYVPWDHKVIETTLRTEAGWQKPSGQLSWRYDCLLEPLLDYTYKKEFGISSAGLYLCGLIRSGLLSRDEALSMLVESENKARLDTHLDKVLKFLQIPGHLRQKYQTSPGRA